MGDTKSKHGEDEEGNEGNEEEREETDDEEEEEQRDDSALIEFENFMEERINMYGKRTVVSIFKQVAKKYRTRGE